MPELVRLYIRNVFVGLGLSVVFVGLLLWLNVANLWHLISRPRTSAISHLVMLIMFNGIVFWRCAVRHCDDADGRRRRQGADAASALRPACASPVPVPWPNPAVNQAEPPPKSTLNG